MTKNEVLANISVCMGGRIAEQIVFGDYTTGASNDIKQATNIARKMVTEWGMSELGFVGFEDDGQRISMNDYTQTQNAYSQSTATAIDAQVKRILDNCYAQSTDILEKNRNIIEEVVTVLLEKETIYQDEFEMICQGKSSSEVIAYMDEKEKQQQIERLMTTLNEEILALNNKRIHKLETVNFVTNNADMPTSEKENYIQQINSNYITELNKIIAEYKEKGAETQTSIALLDALARLEAGTTSIDEIVKIASQEPAQIAEVAENTEKDNDDDAKNTDINATDNNNIDIDNTDNNNTAK